MKKIFSYQKWGAGLLAALVLSFALGSCNKEFPNLLEDIGQDSTSLQLGTRKAILIVLDGAVGSEVRAIAPQNLTLMSDFSIYSYDALTSYRPAANITEERGWTSILTGVYAEKHGVANDDLSQNNLSAFPTIFTRLQNVHSEWQTAAYSTSAKFTEVLAKDADVKQTLASDAAVKDAVIEKLKTDDSVTFITAHLSGIDQAGAGGAYSATNAAYKSAVLKTDEYIGEILSAMRSRDEFANENWLVIVTSSSGSEVAGDPEAAQRNSYQDSRRNSLFFVYNPRFNSQTATKPGAIIPYIGTSPMYNGNAENSKSEVFDDDGLYDFGSEGSYTIQCKVKFKPGGYYYPAFLGKRNSFDGGVPGWVMFLEGDYWMINFGQQGQGNTQVKGQTIADGKWHTLTVVIRQEGNNRMVYTYTDGVYSGNSANIAGKGNINSPAPLTAGYIPGSRFGGGYSPQDYFITDIRIYNEALTQDYIAENYCKLSIPADDPYAADLLGFWPANFVTGSKQLVDFSGNNNPMVVKQLNAVDFSDASNKLCPTISDEVYRTVPNSVDAANQLYLWFGVLIGNDWNLDGKSWIPTFTDLNN